jgi:hypothetical protein
MRVHARGGVEQLISFIFSVATSSFEMSSLTMSRCCSPLYHYRTKARIRSTNAPQWLDDSI